MPKKNVKTETVAVVGQVVGDPGSNPGAVGNFPPSALNIQGDMS